MLDPAQFKKGETSCGVQIHLGSIGKFKAKKKTLVKKMTAISQKVLFYSHFLSFSIERS